MSETPAPALQSDPPHTLAASRQEAGQQRVFLGLLLAAVLLTYSNTLWNQFTFDDQLYIQRNPQVTAPTLENLFVPNQVSNVFRPLTFATFAANWSAGGGQPFGFHVVNLLLHAAVTCLLYLVLHNLLAPRRGAREAAFAAAVLFAVHPIHTEAVTSIVGRAELLAAGFLLAAWLFHLADCEPLALTCFVLALLSKESAVVFLLLVLIGDFAANKSKSYLRYARIVGASLLYLGLLWNVQGGHFGTGAVSRLDNPLASLPAIWRILNAFRVAWKYVWLQLYPAKLSCDYLFDAIPVYMDLRHTLPSLIAASAVLGLWVWAMRRRKAGFALSVGIYLAAFAVTANILLPTGTIMAERLAYLPSAGICLGAGLLWSRLVRTRRGLAFGVLAVAVLVLGMRTVVRNRDWKDNLALFASAVRAAPGSAKAHGNLGQLYLQSGQASLARKELETALRINPDYPGAMGALGLLEARAGNFHEAGRLLEQAVNISGRENPNYDYLVVNLATVMIQADMLDGALEFLDREIAEAPGYGRAWASRGVVHYKRGNHAAARADAEMALRLEPNNLEAKELIQLLDAATRGKPPR